MPAAFKGEYSYPLGLHKPVIAAVNGVAAGLGLSYMLYYDMRIASDRARFGTVFARRGLIAEHGSAWLLPRLVGMANACDLLFSGRLIGAEEALQMGLVNRVVAHDDLLPAVRDVATEMATLCSPRSIRIMKQQLYGDLSGDLAALHARGRPRYGGILLDGGFPRRRRLVRAAPAATVHRPLNGSRIAVPD